LCTMKYFLDRANAAHAAMQASQKVIQHG
jgi:hypothetical protein